MTAETISGVLLLIGLSVGFIGALMMSRAYFSTVRLRDIPSAFIEVWRGEPRAVLDSHDINKENNATVLKGLSLLVVGFLLQAFAALILLCLVPSP